jgi:hypothetical protein
VTAQALFDEVSERLPAEDAALERTQACTAYVTEARRFVAA